MKKVCVITSGGDSDYSIYGVVEGKELAEEIVKKLNGKDPYGISLDIEEWELIESADEVQRLELTHIEINLDGEIVREHTSIHDFWGDKPNEENRKPYVIEGRGPVSVGRPGRGLVAPAIPTSIVMSSYRGREVALRAALDKLAEYKAEKGGIA